jgi:diguanylate cyclase (GGDEF)-like protein
MNLGQQWTELTVQQLVRYEAMFELLDDIQSIEDIDSISRRVAMQWKYFANVANWRLAIPTGEGFLIIDGFRAQAHLAEVGALSAWDQYQWEKQCPCLIRLDAPREPPAPPEHLAGKSIVEIEVMPIVRLDRCVGLLSAAARHEPFSDLDTKFIRLFGRYFAYRIFDILLQRQAIDALTSKATRDTLTGLLNRGAIIDWFDRHLALSRRNGQPLSIVMADIDFFKDINDRYGHLAGDGALREIARRIQAGIRQCDNLGRYGGEEFLLVLYPCDAEEAARIAERIRLAISETPVPIGGHGPDALQVTISLGTACTQGQDTLQIDGFISQADNALYRSKAGGRNRVTAGGAGRS